MKTLVKQLSFLPGFAGYLLENHLEDLSKHQLLLARQLKLPLLRFFKDFSENELLTIGIKGLEELLSAIKDQQINEYIHQSLLNLQNNQLSWVARDSITAEDTVMISFMRRKLFRDRVVLYNPDPKFCVDLMEELDLFLVMLDSKTFETLSGFQTELFEQAQAIAHLGNWVWDLKNNIVIWSKELFAIYQLPYQEKITYDLAAFNHPDDAHLVQENMNISRETKQPCNFVYRIIRPSGETRFLQAHVQVNSNALGEPEKLFGTVQDVTDQKKLEEQLWFKSKEIQDQENLYRKMINEVEDYAILLLSEEGIIENWNIGAEKIKGYKAEEIIGKHLRVFYSKEDQSQKLPEQLIEQASRYGKANHEGWRVRKDGSRFWGSIVISALHDQKGNVIGFTKMTRDLTLRKIAEDSLKQYSSRLEKQNAELSQKNEELESFNYIAGHDLQEPVRKMRIWLNKIDEMQDISPALQGPIARINASCARLQLLLNGLLEYSQTDLITVNRESIDLNLVLDEVFTDLSETLELWNIEIERNTFPTITGVRIQFYQLFFNIISNSVKYRKPDVPLKLTCLASVEKSYHLVFSDNGIGFKQEYSDKIFDLFKRLEPAMNTMGTGLGLAICKKIVLNHMGSISAQSEVGVGTKIEIFLPLEPRKNSIFGQGRL